MKLSIQEDSKNYAVVVVKLPPKQAVQGLDKLVKVTVFGNDILTQKDADENKLYLYFPVECQISDAYLHMNNEFRHSEKNLNRSKTGFFEDTGRVKAIKFRGIISTGYIAPVDSLAGVTDYLRLKEGDEFTDIDGKNICKKYKVVRQGSSGQGESRHNKKLKRFDKLVPNQFRFHTDTAQLARNLHHFNPGDWIVITDKWHGTSAVFSNVMINKKLTWYERLAKMIGLNIVDKEYDLLYSSRSVVKNQYIDMARGPGYYGEDIWGTVKKKLEGKVEQGVTLYGEIVGYLPGGKMIQKDYDYGCVIPLGDHYDLGVEYRFLVYRITYTKPDGTVLEFPWVWIKRYCQKYNLETVKEIWRGDAVSLYPYPTVSRTEESDNGWREKVLSNLSHAYLEGDCKYCVNKVPAEGICVRIDGRDTYMTFKLKSKRFLERETKELDKGEINIEDEQIANT